MFFKHLLKYYTLNEVSDLLYQGFSYAGLKKQYLDIILKGGHYFLWPQGGLKVKQLLALTTHYLVSVPMNEDRWSWPSDADEDNSLMNEEKQRIPTTHKPLSLFYIKPFTEYLDQWKNDSIFYQDFIYSCPFNNEVTKHMVNKTETLSTHKAWGYLFEYFSTTYTVDELADLVYESLSNLNEGQHYLKFLLNHHYTHMWPKGKKFCDPSLTIPFNPQL